MWSVFDQNTPWMVLDYKLQDFSTNKSIKWHVFDYVNTVHSFGDKIWSIISSHTTSFPWFMDWGFLFPLYSQEKVVTTLRAEVPGKITKKMGSSPGIVSRDTHLPAVLTSGILKRSLVHLLAVRKNSHCEVSSCKCMVKINLVLQKIKRFRLLLENFIR